MSRYTNSCLPQQVLIVLPGLDTTRYQQISAGGGDVEREFHTLESQISDADRFRDAEPLRVACRHCRTETTFSGMSDNADRIIRSIGLICPNIECSCPIEIPSLAMQLENQVRSYINKFYESWLLCDDPSCQNRTRMMSVYGKRCLKDQCRGMMHYEVSVSLVH